MARSQLKSKRKASGGRYPPARSKKKRELSRLPTMTRLDQKKSKPLRIKGGHLKTVLLSINEANVTDKKGKTKKAKVLNVIENPANPNLVRRNIITKGTIIETDLGKAKVTGRPGQEGGLNAVLL